jgi:hypothetical protein
MGDHLKGLSSTRSLKNQRRLKTIKRIAASCTIAAVILVTAFFSWIPQSEGITLSPFEFLTHNFPWPSKWSDNAQSALAGTIITALATIGASIFAFVFQRLRVRAEAKIGTYRQLLTRSQGYATNYIPLVQSAAQLAAWLRTMEKDQDESQLICQQFAFFHFCRFYRLSADLRESKSYFLTDLSAETAALRLEIRIRKGPDGFLKPIDYSAIVALFQPDIKFYYFQDKLELGTFADVFDRFQQWLQKKPATVQETIRHADCYAQLLIYEFNLLHADWYGRLPYEPSEDNLRLIRRYVPEYRLT